MTVAAFAAQIADEGGALLPDVFTAAECAALVARIESGLNACSDPAAALRRRGGSLYGARNILQLIPSARELWRRPPLVELLELVLGADVRLVRGLYFDKPPTATWSLPWHQDTTIAVQDHSRPSSVFTRPTRKAGVPHVEAPREILERMLTLRIHLDPAVPENGPLQVLPGSHRLNAHEFSRLAPRTILSPIGAVFAMRPLLAHCSGVSQPGTTLHRRVLHLEFTGLRDLPDGYAWAFDG